MGWGVSLGGFRAQQTVQEEHGMQVGTFSDVRVSSLGGAATVARTQVLVPRAPLLLGCDACSCVPVKDICPSIFCITPAGLELLYNV